MFDILTRDSLRQNIESASKGKNTVLYDIKGNPSFMAVIPKMTLSEVLPITLGRVIEDPYNPGYYIKESGSYHVSTEFNETHPAFKIKLITGEEYEASEIFIGQYHNTMMHGLPCSLPGHTPAWLTYENAVGRFSLTDLVQQKGPNWHTTNILEYSLLQMWSHKSNIELYGEDLGLSKTLNNDPYHIDLYIMEFDGEVSLPEEYTEATDGVVLSEIVSDFYWSHGSFYYDSIKNKTYIEISYLDTSNYASIDAWITEVATDIGTSFRLYSIPTTGLSPVNCRHDNTFAGVHGLISSGEFIEGFRIYKPASDNDSDLVERKVHCIVSNYKWLDDSLLIDINCKHSNYEDHINRFVNSSEPRLNVDNQSAITEVDGTAFRILLNGDTSIEGHRPIMRILLDDDDPHSMCQNPVANRILTITGIDPVNFFDGDVIEDIDSKLIIHTTSKEESFYILVKGYHFSNTNKIYTRLLTMAGDPPVYTFREITGVPNSMWFSRFVDKNYQERMFFRSTYIP